MSFRVLVISKDFTKDEHILRPLVQHILGDSGRTAQVMVCREPNFQGVNAALNLDLLRSKVVALYPMVDLFLLFVDRDGVEGRKTRTDQIEGTLSGELAEKRKALLAEVAWQEVEIFVLAGHDLPPA